MKIREWWPEPPRTTLPAGLAAYRKYRRNTIYKRAFLCEGCYRVIDSHPTGHSEIPGLGEWNLDIASRHGRAAVYDKQKYERFQIRQAATMGLAWLHAPSKKPTDRQT